MMHGQKNIKSYLGVMTW